MPTLTIEYQTEAERLLLEQALAFFAQMRQAASTAPDGTVLAACERVALGSGRQLVRDTLGGAAQSRADGTDASQKSWAQGSKGNAPVGS